VRERLKVKKLRINKLLGFDHETNLSLLRF